MFHVLQCDMRVLNPAELHALLWQMFYFMSLLICASSAGITVSLQQEVTTPHGDTKTNRRQGPDFKKKRMFCSTGADSSYY